MQTLAIATFQNERDTSPRCGEIAWLDLVKDLSLVRRTPCAPCKGHGCRAKSGPAWSPTDLIEPRRGAAHVRAITAAVFDLDAVPDSEMASLAERIEGYRYVCHSTHAGRGYYRLVMALSRPVLAAEWARFWPAAVAYLGVPADPKAKDASRLYYFPSAPEGSEPIVETGEGEPLNVDAILATYRAPSESRAEGAPVASGEIGPSATVFSFEGLRGESKALVDRIRKLEPLADVGARDDTLNRLMSVLANLPGATHDGAMSLIATSLERMQTEPEGLEFWRAKASGCFTRAAERRAKRDAQAESDRAALLGVLGREPAKVVEGTSEEWRRGLLYRTDKDGNPTGLQHCEANLELILQNDLAWRGTLKFNALRKTVDVFGGPLAGIPAADQEFAAAAWFQRSEYRIDMKRYDYGAALLRVARQNEYDPLREYLLGLKWDGQNRARYFFETYLGAAKNEVVRVLAQKWLVSAAARGLAPGCKVDTALILQGDYGARKTTFVEAMAGKFYSNAKIDFGSNDSRQAAARYWLIEMAELAGLKAATREAVKDWLSTRVDSFRPPYGRVLEDFPRRAVFVGTVNESEFLPEPNRREWVIRVGADIDIEGLMLVRDQLWAEAVAIYLAGETCPTCAESRGGRCGEHSWWLVGSTAEAVRELAREFQSPDPWRDAILDWFIRLDPTRRPREITTTEIAVEALGFPKDRLNLGVMHGVGCALKSLSFAKIRKRRAGMAVWVYTTPEAILSATKGERMRPLVMDVIDGGQSEGV